MFESGITRSGIDHPRETELPDPTESLNNRRIQYNEFPGFDTNGEPNWIVDDLKALRDSPVSNGLDVRLNVVRENLLKLCAYEA